MINNIFRTSLRFITKNPGFAIINLLGLTAGIAAFLLIALYIQDQRSFDKHLPYPERLYRLTGIQEPDGLDKQHVSYTSAAWAPWIMENIPQVEEAFRIMQAHSLVEIDREVFMEPRIYFSEGNVLTHMGLPVLHGGNPSLMLTNPNTAVISRTTAQRFFGRADVVGETLRIAGEPYIITGVFENEHIQSHLNFNILLSFSTLDPDTPFLMLFGNNTLATYVVLRPGTDPLHISQLINQKQTQLQEEDPGRMMRNTFYLQPSNDFYLRSQHLKFHMRTHQGNQNTVLIFSIVAVLILAIACINFINLSTAQAGQRARETGLRKILGANRSKLTLQYMGESFLLTFLAVLAALGFTELILPWYNTLLNTSLEIDFAGNPLFNVGLLALFLGMGTMSGFYPALYLSRFQPAHVLRSAGSSGKPRQAGLRKTLVIVQFSISSAMILATAVVSHQVNLMQQKDLGYNPQEVVSIFIRHTRDYDQIRSFAQKLQQFPEVLQAGISSGHNGVAGRQSMITTADSVPVTLMVRFGYTDPDFFPTMHIPVSQGRNFSHENYTDPRQTMIINRAAQRALGWTDPVGKRVINNDDEEFDFFTIIGVIEDYHYYSLHSAIEPAVYIWRPGEMNVINLRYRSTDPARLIQNIEQAYQSHFPGQFFQARFLTDILNNQYLSEKNTLYIFMGFALLCILISCLGLFGLTSFMVNQKRKEISIRKVLGASVLQINTMLLVSFLQWVLLSAFIAFPLTWYLMHNWLAGFAYRVAIGWPHFAITLALIATIASATILSLSTHAARQNPASAIKCD